MDDKDTTISFRNRAIFIDGKELPTVEDSIRFDEGHDKLVDPFPQNKLSFNFYCEHPEFKKWLKDNPLTHAQEMLNALNKELKEFHTTNPPSNRKERRERMRGLTKKFERFKAYCEEYGLEYEIKSLKSLQD